MAIVVNGFPWFGNRTTGSSYDRTGDLDQSIGAITLSADGKLALQAALSQSIGNITLSAAGVLPLVGTLSQSIGDITLSATGQLAIAGTLSQSIGDITLTAAGVLPIQAALSQSVGDITLLADGTLGTPAGITGTLDVTIDQITLTADATIADAASELVGRKKRRRTKRTIIYYDEAKQETEETKKPAAKKPRYSVGLLKTIYELSETGEYTPADAEASAALASMRALRAANQNLSMAALRKQIADIDALIADYQQYLIDTEEDEILLLMAA